MCLLAGKRGRLIVASEHAIGGGGSVDHGYCIGHRRRHDRDPRHANSPHGIDVPESRRVCMRPTGEEWRCGQQAALALSERIGRSTIRCEPRDRDRYGRIVAICFKGNDDMNRWMVASGWAVAYRKYSWDYVVDEERAHSGRFKLWSGSFEMLWDWRQQRQHR